MLGPGGDNIGGLGGDHGAVRVGNQAGVGESGNVGVASVGHGTHGVDHSTGGGELGLGGGHGRLIDGDHGAVGVGDQASEGVAGGVGVGEPGVGVASVGHGVDGAPGRGEGSLGGLDLRGVDGGDGAVGVGHQLGGGDGHAGSKNLARK